MPLTKLQFRSGVNKDTTSYTNEGGWFDSDKVRFRQGLPEKIGGWAKKSIYSFLAPCRSLHPWVTLAGTSLLGVGTRFKIYIERGGFYNDITPYRSTPAGAITFAATNGSSTINVNHNSHGAVDGDFVTFSSAASLGGNITADVLNQEYQVTIVSDNNYTFTARTAGTSIASITEDGVLNPTPVLANGSDTGNGGASVAALYQVNVGLGVAVPGTGWGAGTWGADGWGEPSTLTTVSSLRTWSMDNWGEDLLLNPRDGNIYYWDTSSKTLGTDRAVAISTLGTDAGTPTVAKQVLVSDRDRHTLVFGADPVDAIGTQDPLLIRFSSQESLTEWTPTPTNTAGSLRVGNGSEIVTAVETRQQVLVYTDTAVHAMQFLGPPFTFGINQLSDNTTIAGPSAAVAVDDAVYWMGYGDFYVYNGSVSKINCPVKSFVFENYNLNQQQLTTVSSNSKFSEIWWFYPSENSSEIDRYVIFNYQENTWAIGNLPRTAWLDSGIYELPIAASTDGYLYFHETGQNDGSTNPSQGITSFIESSPLSLGAGDSFAFINRIIPDVLLTQSEDATASVDFTLKTANFPGANFSQTNTATVQQSSTVPVAQFTEQAFTRLRGRSFALRVESTGKDVQWRLGTPRVDVREDGRR
tara:strand:+ start:2376 stop:4292 length:1917 start_codon:yes stop_codon:yes gene_type:complete